MLEIYACCEIYINIKGHPFYRGGIHTRGLRATMEFISIAHPCFYYINDSCFDDEQKFSAIHTGINTHGIKHIEWHYLNHQVKIVSICPRSKWLTDFI